MRIPLNEEEKSTVLRAMARRLDPGSDEYEALVSAIVAFDKMRWEIERRKQEVREVLDAVNLMWLQDAERKAATQAEDFADAKGDES